MSSLLRPQTFSSELLRNKMIWKVAPPSVVWSKVPWSLVIQTSSGPLVQTLTKSPNTGELMRVQVAPLSTLWKMARLRPTTHKSVVPVPVTSFRSSVAPGIVMRVQVVALLVVLATTAPLPTTKTLFLPLPQTPFIYAEVPGALVLQPVPFQR